MRTVVQASGVIGAAVNRKPKRVYDANNNLATVVKMVVSRMGLNLSALAIGMGYETPSSLRISEKTNASYATRNVIQALRDLGATEDEMRALITAYVVQTGDVSFLSDDSARRKIAQIACDVLDNKEELFLPRHAAQSPFVDRKKAITHAREAERRKLNQCLKNARKRSREAMSRRSAKEEK